MNHPENITFILVVYNFAKKSTKNKTKPRFWLHFRWFVRYFDTFVRYFGSLRTFLFSETKAGPLQKQIRILKFWKDRCFNQLPSYLNPGRLSTEGRVKVFMKPWTMLRLSEPIVHVHDKNKSGNSFTLADTGVVIGGLRAITEVIWLICFTWVNIATSPLFLAYK